MSNANFDNEAFHADVWTSDQKGVRRLQVEPQQTSFENGSEFYWSYDFAGVPPSNDIVIRVTIGTNPVILFDRIFNILSGARTYRAYPVGYGEVVTGDFSDETARIRPTNYNAEVLQSSTAQWEVSTNASFTPGLAPSVGAPGSLIASTQGNTSQGGAYSGNSLKLGYPAGTQFYIVFSAYGSTNDLTDLEFFMAWEQL